MVRCLGCLKHKPRTDKNSTIVRILLNFKTNSLPRSGLEIPLLRTSWSGVKQTLKFHTYIRIHLFCLSDYGHRHITFQAVMIGISTQAQSTSKPDQSGQVVHPRNSGSVCAHTTLSSGTGQMIASENVILGNPKPLMSYSDRYDCIRIKFGKNFGGQKAFRITFFCFYARVNYS